MNQSHCCLLASSLLAGQFLLSELGAQTPLATWQAVAPGFNGSFNKPSLNEAGRMAYLNKTNGFSLGTAGSPAERSLQPFLASLGLGLDVAYSVAGDNGRVGYLVAKGLVDDAPGAQKVLAAVDGPVPGLPAGVNFSADTFNNSSTASRNFGMTPSGVFVLPAVLQGTGIVSAGSVEINDQVVMRGPAGDFKPIVRAGATAPGLPSGFVFAGHLTRPFDAVINREGVTAIRARAIHWNPPSPFPLQNAEGIWLHDPVAGLQLALTAVSQGVNPRGDTAPGTDEARFTAITVGPAINDKGFIAFAANTFNFAASPPARSGIWSGPVNDLQPVHLFGASVPGLPGVTFDNPFDNAGIKLGSGRTVCFTTVLAGAGVTAENNVGVFLGAGLTDVRLLARIGTQAPGLPVGVNFQSIPGDAVVIFGDNRIAIRALISGPGVVGGVNDKGLWMTDNQGSLQLVARLGEVASTDLGSQLMLGDFVLQHGTGQDGLASSGNRSDQLAVYNNGVVNQSYAYLLTVGTPVPPSPTLTYAFTNDGLTFDWPAGYKLQSSPTLSSKSWGDLSSAPPFTLQATDPQRWFRLVGRGGGTR